MKPLFAIGAVALALTGCRTGDALSTGRDGAIPTRLAFGADKAFAVLHVTDVQDNGKLPARSAAVLRAALAATRPQLVILTGDNVDSGGNSTNAFPRAMEPLVALFEEFHAPFCVTFGNHD
ncbi:MAG: metallophosphoesterase, partial [Kiritimatiellae bacterium]|nr:metallophosphoesterase [Kiritimatiellia bacterium]